MKETKFKDTILGKIPEDWDLDIIDNLASITTGAQNTQDKSENGKYPFFVRSQQVERINKYIFDTEGVITAGDGVGTGKIFHYINGKFGLHQRCYLIYNFKRIDAKYFYRVFSECFYDRVMSMSAKTSVDSVRREMISDMYIKFPKDIAEQNRIATALSDIDSLIESLGKLIQKKRNIKQGAMQELLTGKKRLKGFTKPWVEKTLGEIGYTYNGLTGKSSNDFGVGNSKYITFLNVLNNVILRVDQFEKVDVKPSENQNKAKFGDLFFNTSSETPEEVGICAVLQNDLDNLYLNSFCFGFRLTDKTNDGLFLSYLFRSKSGRDIMTALAQGSTRYNLSKDQFLKTAILLPSTLEEQTAIARILSDMDKEIEALEAKQKKYKSIKEGMMQELLSGRIRLI